MSISGHGNIFRTPPRRSGPPSREVSPVTLPFPGRNLAAEAPGKLKKSAFLGSQLTADTRNDSSHPVDGSPIPRRFPIHDGTGDVDSIRPRPTGPIDEGREPIGGLDQLITEKQTLLLDAFNSPELVEVHLMGLMGLVRRRLTEPVLLLENLSNSRFITETHDGFLFNTIFCADSDALPSRLAEKVRQIDSNHSKVGRSRLRMYNRFSSIRASSATYIGDHHWRLIIAYIFATKQAPEMFNVNGLPDSLFQNPDVSTFLSNRSPIPFKLFDPDAPSRETSFHSPTPPMMSGIEGFSASLFRTEAVEEAPHQPELSKRNVVDLLRQLIIDWENPRASIENRTLNLAVSQHVMRCINGLFPVKDPLFELTSTQIDRFVSHNINPTHTMLSRRDIAAFFRYLNFISSVQSREPKDDPGKRGAKNTSKISSRLLFFDGDSLTQSLDFSKAASNLTKLIDKNITSPYDMFNLASPTSRKVMIYIHEFIRNLNIDLQMMIGVLAKRPRVDEETGTLVIASSGDSTHLYPVVKSIYAYLNTLATPPPRLSVTDDHDLEKRHYSAEEIYHQHMTIGHGTLDPIFGSVSTFLKQLASLNLNRIVFKLAIPPSPEVIPATVSPDGKVTTHNGTSCAYRKLFFNFERQEGDLENVRVFEAYYQGQSSEKEVRHPYSEVSKRRTMHAKISVPLQKKQDSVLEKYKSHELGRTFQAMNSPLKMTSPLKSRTAPGNIVNTADETLGYAFGSQSCFACRYLKYHYAEQARLDPVIGPPMDPLEPFRRAHGVTVTPLRHTVPKPSDLTHTRTPQIQSPSVYTEIQSSERDGLEKIINDLQATISKTSKPGKRQELQRELEVIQHAAEFRGIVTRQPLVRDDTGLLDLSF